MRRIAKIAVFNGPLLLMGLRRDNLKWTMPGGHVEEGETHLEGAVRELAEETGIVVDPSVLQHLETFEKQSFSGDVIELSFYRLETTEDPHRFDDPDREVHDWLWQDVSAGSIPVGIANALHVPKDDLLAKLGLLPKEGAAEALAKAFLKPFNKILDGSRTASKVATKEAP